jgi:hypothetical protein
MKHINLFAFLQDTVYHAIDVRLVAIEQVPEIRILACHWAAVRISLEAKDCFFKAPIPFQSGVGILDVNFVIKMTKITLRAASDINEVCHAGFRNYRRTPLPA